MRDAVPAAAVTWLGVATIGSPADEPGITIHMILASCQAIATTSIRVTQRGNSWLAADSVRSLSKLVKSDQFASIVIKT